MACPAPAASSTVAFIALSVPSALRTYAEGTTGTSESIDRRTSPARLPSPADKPLAALPD